jgi:hypothetical protein
MKNADSKIKKREKNQLGITNDSLMNQNWRLNGSIFIFCLKKMAHYFSPPSPFLLIFLSMTIRYSF